MCTTWVDGADFAKAMLGMEASETAKQVAKTLKACLAQI
jgi:hypothetical protein